MITRALPAALACAAALFSPTASAEPDYPVFTPEDFAPLECEFPVPLIMDLQYVPSAPECAMRMTWAFNQIIEACAWSGPEQCLLLSDHIIEYYAPCFELAVKNKK